VVYLLVFVVAVGVSAFAWVAAIGGGYGVSQGHGGGAAAALCAAGVTTLVVVYVLTRRATRKLAAHSPAVSVMAPLLTLLLGLLAMPFAWMVLFPNFGD